MWNIEESIVCNPNFQKLEPKEILYEFDGPKIFTIESFNSLFFAYFSDINYEKEEYRIIVCETDSREISNLKSGYISLDEVLKKEYLWVIDFDFDDNQKNLNLIRNGYDFIPAKNKPEQGTLLWPELKKQNELPTLARTHGIATVRTEQMREKYCYMLEESLDSARFSVTLHVTNAVSNSSRVKKYPENLWPVVDNLPTIKNHKIINRPSYST